MAKTKGKYPTRTEYNAQWMKDFENAVLELNPSQAGKIDWKTAIYLRNMNYASMFAAKKYLESVDGHNIHCTG